MAVLFPDILDHNNDTKALVDDNSIRGGHYIVDNIAARDAIGLDKRKIGMIVTYTDTGVNYTKRFDGTATDDSTWQNDANWVDVGTGGSGGNPFDQDLNTTDNVTFAFLSNTALSSARLVNSTSTVAGTLRWDGSSFQGYDGTSWIGLGGTISSNPFDQNLNTTDDVTFNAVDTSLITNTSSVTFNVNGSDRLEIGGFAIDFKNTPLQLYGSGSPSDAVTVGAGLNSATFPTTATSTYLYDSILNAGTAGQFVKTSDGIMFGYGNATGSFVNSWLIQPENSNGPVFSPRVTMDTNAGIDTGYGGTVDTLKLYAEGTEVASFSTGLGLQVEGNIQANLGSITTSNGIIYTAPLSVPDLYNGPIQNGFSNNFVSNPTQDTEYNAGQFIQPGHTFTLVIKIDATGGYNLTMDPTNFTPFDGAGSIDSSPNAVNVVTAIAVDTTTYYYDVRTVNP